MKRKALPEKIGGLVWDVLRKRGYEIKIKEQMVIQNWKEIVGNRVAQETTPKRIENGIIFLKVSSAPWQNELTYLKAEIVQKINDFAGKPVVKDIIFTRNE